MPASTKGSGEPTTPATGSDREKLTSFNAETEFNLVEFEDYYDELFGDQGENNNDYTLFQQSIRPEYGQCYPVIELLYDTLRSFLCNYS